MGNFIESLGMQAASGVVSGAMGMMLGAQNDTRQIEQQQKLQDMQIRGSKELSDYQFAKQLQMWKDTSYSAQKEQMIKAGLNPGLMYGMSGGGGTTTGSGGGGVSGASAPAGGREVQDMMGMGMQMQLLKAQKENIEADTANKQADTANKPLQGEQITTQTASIAQGIKNQELSAELTKLETRLKGIDERMKNETYKEQVDVIVAAADQAKNAVDRAKNQLEIDLATKNATIDKIRAEAVGAVLRNTLTEAQTRATEKGIQVDDATMNKMKKDIENAVRGLDQNDLRIQLEAWKAELEKSMPGIGNVLGRVLNGAMEQLSNLFTKRPLDTYEAPKKQ